MTARYLEKALACLLCCAIPLAADGPSEPPARPAPTVDAEVLPKLLRKKKVTVCLKDKRCVEGRYGTSGSGVVEVQEKTEFDVTVLPLSDIDTIAYRGGTSRTENWIAGGWIAGMFGLMAPAQRYDAAASALGGLMAVGVVLGTVMLIRQFRRPKTVIRIRPASVVPPVPETGATGADDEASPMDESTDVSRPGRLDPSQSSFYN
jgi:hypothetical protein